MSRSPPTLSKGEVESILQKKKNIQELDTLLACQPSHWMPGDILQIS